MAPGAEPLRMRANKKVVETKCLTCNNAFAYSEEVCACPQCGGYHHARCWDPSRECTHNAAEPAPYDAAPSALATAEPRYAAPPPPPPPPPPQYQTMPPTGGMPPPPPIAGMPPPPQFAQPMLAPYDQFCPSCRNIIKIGALRCRFCNYSFAFVPGMQGPMNQPPPYGVGVANYGAPYGLQFDLNGMASGSRTCGLLAVIFFATFFLVILLMAAADVRDRTASVIVPLFVLMFIASLILAIVAVVKGHGARRLLEQFPSHDYSLRGKATAGVVMGWIVIGLFGLLLIVGLVAAAANGR